MPDLSYRGIVRGGAIVLQGTAIPLADGTEVIVAPVVAPPGSPAVVLAAIAAAPAVPAEWVNELETLIAQGRRPPTRHDPFADVPSRLERP